MAWVSKTGGKPGSLCWQVRERHPERPKQWRLVKSFRTEREAEKFRYNYEPEHADPAPSSARELAWKQALVEYIDATEAGRDGEPPVAPWTVTAYRLYASKHLVPKIGSRVVASFEAREAERLRDELLATASIGRETAKKIFGLARAAYRWTARRHKLNRMNPFDGLRIRKSKREKKRVVIPERAEITRLLVQAETWSRSTNKTTAKAWRRYAPMIWLFALAGPRISEVRGVWWSDFDLDRGIWSLQRSADHYGTVGEPKSAAATREVGLPPAMVKLLRQWKIACAPRVAGIPLVFPTGSGGVEGYSNIRQRAWLPLLAECGYAETIYVKTKYRKRQRRFVHARWSIHAMRHFKVSDLIDRGAEVNDIMEEIGHASAAMTTDTYGHLFQARRRLRQGHAAALERDLKLTSDVKS